MPRQTKAQRGETTQVTFGINLQSCEVELVFSHRDGSLTNHGALPSTHHVFGRRKIEDEVMIVWHLGHLISFLPGHTDSESAREQIADLKKKAAKMKAELGK